MNLSDLFTQYGFQLETMLVSIFLGLLVALGILLYNRYVPGKIVRFLLNNRVHTEEASVTLAQAGVSGRSLTARTLRDGSMLRKLIVCLPDAENGVDEKGRTRLECARFYLPEDKCYRADLAYNSNGASVLTVLLTVLIFLAMLLLVAFLAPQLIQMFRNFISSLKG